MSERADRVKRMERESTGKSSTVIATDASTGIGQFNNTNNTIGIGVLRPEYDGVTAY